VPAKKETRDEASALVRLLVESSVATAPVDLEMAKRQAALARRLRLRYNIRPGMPHKAFTCKGCKGLLVPGVNARVRLGHGKPKAVRVTCQECGRVSRLFIEMA
jgi:ribonuclease P protein subunit RPR2